MIRFVPLFVVAGGLSTLLGCGGGSTYHCDFRGDGEPRCQERQARVVGTGAVTSEAFLQTCTLSGGEGADGPCPLDEAVAGCDVTFGAGGEVVIDWSYPPETAGTVEAACDEAGGTLVLS